MVTKETNKIKEEFNLTKEPIIKEMIYMENKMNLVFDREEMNDLLFKLVKQTQKQATADLIKKIEIWQGNVWNSLLRDNCKGIINKKPLLFVWGDKVKELKQMLVGK